MNSPSVLPANLPLRCFIALYTFLICLCKIGDSDYWTHLALGRAYWQAGKLTIGEPFILSRLGAQLESDERLFQLMLYPLHVAGSDEGVCLVVALLAGLVFYVLSVMLPGNNNSGAVSIAVVYLAAVSYAVQFRFVPRPESVAYLLFAMCIVLVWSWREKPTRGKLLLLGCLFAFWMQLHVTWTIGAVLVGVTLIVKPRSDFWRSQLTSLSGRIFVAVAGILILFAGHRAIAFGLNVTKYIMPEGILNNIEEMRPLWEYPHLFKKCGTLALVSLIFSWGGKDGRAGRVFVWAIAALLGLFVVRNAAISLLGMVPGALKGLCAMVQFPRGKVNMALTVASLLILISIFVLRVQDPEEPWGVGVRWSLFPRDAAAFVKTHKLPGVVFNNWECGGYLDWAWGGSPPTFLDGRLGNSEVMALHAAIVENIDPASTIERLGVRTILIQPLYFNSVKIFPGLFWLMAQPDWHIVLSGDAMVFVHEPLPSGLVSLTPREAWSTLVGHIKSIAPGCSDRQDLLYSLALAHYYSWDLDAARKTLDLAKRRNPELLEEYRNYFLFPVK